MIWEGGAGCGGERGTAESGEGVGKAVGLNIPALKLPLQL